MKELMVKYWLEAILGLITAGLGWAYRKLKRKVDEQGLIKEGMLAILHDRLFQAGRYYTEKGEITFDEIKNIEYLYNSYHALGGNGTGTEIWERIKALPVKS